LAADVFGVRKKTWIILVQDFSISVFQIGRWPCSTVLLPLDVLADCPVADIARSTEKKIVILEWHFRSAAIAHDGFF
jgi:hypothetical protein